MSLLTSTEDERTKDEVARNEVRFDQFNERRVLVGLKPSPWTGYLARKWHLNKIGVDCQKIIGNQQVDNRDNILFFNR